MKMRTHEAAKATSTPTSAIPPQQSGLLPLWESGESDRSLLSSEDRLRWPSSPTPIHPSSVGHRFGAMAIGSPSTPVLQRKLAIGQPGDRYEQEADQVADQVMQMPAPKIQRLCPECKEELQRQPMAEEEEKEEETLQTKPLAESITPLIQRQTEPTEEEKKEEEETLQTKPLAGSINPLIQRQTEPTEEEKKKEKEETLQTKSLAGSINPLIQRQMEPTEEEKKKKEEETLQTKPASGEASTASPALQNQITALQGGGQPLSESERHFFEPRFGTDFSQVRIHADNQAAEAARAVNARAFTLGRDVVFGVGEYQPRSAEGQRLLAHELTHVVQQSRSGMRRCLLERGLERGTNAKVSSVKNHQIQIAIRGATPIKIARQAPMDPRLARGYAGEQSMGFGYSAEKGWILVEGPGGSAGHGVTTRGFDGVAYNAKADELHLIDNKSLKAETARSATAITENLKKNLDALVSKVEGMKDMPKRIRILQLLKQMRDAVATGKQLPKNTKLICTGEGGQVKYVSPSLQKLGVEFRKPGTTDLPPAKVPASPPATPTPETKLPPSAKPPGVSATPETPSSAKPMPEPTIPPVKGPASPPAMPTPVFGAKPSTKVPSGELKPVPKQGIRGRGRVLRGGPAAMIGQLLGDAIQSIGDISIQRRIRSELEQRRAEIAEYQNANPSEGVLVIITLQEWAIADEQGRRARNYFSLNLAYGGQTQAQALHRWQSVPRLLAAPPRGWRPMTQYLWIPPLQ